MIDTFAWIAPAVWGLAGLLVVVMSMRPELPKKQSTARGADDLPKAA